jgi:Rrf2 family transcriptional regulator, iron-sulfur cluster assembly transcription factor
MLNNSSRYAIRAVNYLGSPLNQNKKTGIRQMASDLNIPGPFLGKILQRLVREKILKSNKGPNGGFSLARKAQKISLYDIIVVMEGNELFESCLLGSGHCSTEKENGKFCTLHYQFEEIRNQLTCLYKSQTIADLVSGALQNDAVGI